MEQIYSLFLKLDHIINEQKSSMTLKQSSLQKRVSKLTFQIGLAPGRLLKYNFVIKHSSLFWNGVNGIGS